MTPAQPVAGQPVEIEVTGEAGADYVITDGDTVVCEGTLHENGNATCEWASGEDGQIELTITVGDQTVEELAQPRIVARA